MEERIEDRAFRIDELYCLCGCEYVYRNRPKVGGITLTQLFCPKCGLSMKALDGAYEWLAQHWRDTVMEGVNTAVAGHKQSQQDAVMEHFSGMPGYSEIEAAKPE